MASMFSYFDTTVRPAETLAGRLLRTASVVANCWTVLASALLFFTLDKHSLLSYRLRMFAIGALCIAAGMFSLILPFHFILKTHAREEDSRSL